MFSQYYRLLTLLKAFVLYLILVGLSSFNQTKTHAVDEKQE